MEFIRIIRMFTNQKANGMWNVSAVMVAENTAGVHRGMVLTLMGGTILVGHVQVKAISRYRCREQGYP